MDRWSREKRKKIGKSESNKTEYRWKLFESRSMTEQKKFISAMMEYKKNQSKQNNENTRRGGWIDEVGRNK